MATVGSLIVKLGASLGSFPDLMRQAGKHIRSLGSVSDQVSSRFSSLATGLAAAATGGGIVVLLKQQFKAIDATAKLSDQLGISTEELVGFDHAAGLSGVAAEDLHKGLQRMVRVLGESKTGFGEGIKGLELLGLEAKEVSRMTPAEAFRTIAEAIRRIDDPARRAAAAYAIFGKSGQNLINVLSGGRGALEAAQKEVERIGVTFSREAARGVEEANDAIETLQLSFAGLGRQIAIELAPVLAFWAKDLTTAMAGTTKQFKELNKDSKSITQNMSGLQRAMLWLQEIGHGAVVIFKAASVFLKEDLATLADWLAKLDKWYNDILRKTAQLLKLPYDEKWDTSVWSRGFADAMKDAAKTAREEYEKWMAETKTPTERYKQFLREQEAAAAAARAAAGDKEANEDNLKTLGKIAKLHEEIARATERAGIEKTVAEFKLPDWEKQALGWSRQGGSPWLIEQFRSASKALDEAKKIQKRQEEFEKFREDQPEEKYRQQMADLRQWVSMGLPAAEAQRAAGEYARQLLSSTERTGGLAPALMRGTAEEISARNQAIYGGARDEQRELRNLIRQELVELRQIRAANLEIRDKLVKPALVEVAPR